MVADRAMTVAKTQIDNERLIALDLALLRTREESYVC